MAVDRQAVAPAILVIDRGIPEFDRDAGSRTCWQSLQLLLDCGFRVSFLSASSARPEPYTRQLEQLGVRVLAGPLWRVAWPLWLLVWGRQFQYVGIHRPQIAARFLRWVRWFTRAKVLYYGHDLHFLRENRLQLLAAPGTATRTTRLRRRELGVIRAVDVAYFPSTFEVETLRELVPEARVRVLSYWFFAESPADAPRVPPPAQQVLFVGNFRHLPNVDGLRWFLEEVIPELRRQSPAVEIVIVGENPPAEIVQSVNAHHPHVHFRGYVSDDQLATLYRESRVAIVPLRAGAGVKGKLVEALHFGVPVVTTSLGAEGLPPSPTIISTDVPADFATGISRLLSDDESWREYSAAGQAYVAEHFSRDAVLRELAREIPELAGSWPCGKGAAT